MPTRAHQIHLDDGAGPIVLIAELTPTQMLTAAKMVGREPSPTVRTLKLGGNAAKMGIVSVDGDSSQPTKDKVLKHPRWANQLASAWAQMYLPTQAQMDAVGAMAVTSGLDGETWTLQLPSVGPDGKDCVRVVVLAMVESSTVHEAIREAEISAGSETAQAFLSNMSGPARSIVSVDGGRVSLEVLRAKGPNGAYGGWDSFFSVPETYALGAAFARIHGADALGEVTPVASSG